MIVAGVLFLLAQFDLISLTNWWALFILLPALSSLVTSFELYRRSRRFSIPVRGSLIGGLLLLTTALMFLLNLSWAVYWPLFLIIPGLWMISNGIPERGGRYPFGRSIATWMIWTGAAVCILGIGFLLKFLGVCEPEAYVKNWWAFPILLPVIGGLIRIGQIFAEKKRLNLEAMANLLVIVSFGVVGAVALAASWNFLLPVLLIAGGVILLASRLAWK